MDPLCELFQTPDDQMQATVGCLNGSDSIPFGAQMIEPLLQTGHTRPELVGADHLIGVAVNQPIGAALQTRDLSVQRVQVGIWPAVLGHRGAPLVLGGNPLGIIQHCLDFAPDGGLELVAAYRTVVARGVAAELVGIGADAAIVAVVGQLASADHAARHLAIERVTAASADRQALQQPAAPASAIALALAVLIKLGAGRLEQVRVHDGRRRG